MSKKKSSFKALKEKSSGLLAEFKKFITRGNVIDMAVGVIIGGAFTAIVNALVQGILMPLITAAIPNGGIEGLVTVLNHSKAYVCESTDTAAIAAAELAGQQLTYYWGHAYDASVVTVINWGTVVNAIIHFLFVALILFTVLKTFTYLTKKREAMAAKLQEEHYKKHPEERPQPEPVVVEEKKPTEAELLTAILEEIKSKKAE